MRKICNDRLAARSSISDAISWISTTPDRSTGEAEIPCLIEVKRVEVDGGDACWDTQMSDACD